MSGGDGSVKPRQSFDELQGIYDRILDASQEKGDSSRVRIDQIIVRVVNNNVVIQKRGSLDFFKKTIDDNAAERLKTLFDDVEKLDLTGVDESNLKKFEQMAKITGDIVDKTLGSKKAMEADQDYKPGFDVVKTPKLNQLKYEIKKICNKADGAQLYIACQRNDVDGVRELINKNSSIEYYSDISNYQDENGVTPLHMACFSNNIEIFKIILENHPNLNLKDKNGLTPLHLAYAVGNTEMIEELKKSSRAAPVEDDTLVGYERAFLIRILKKGNTEEVEKALKLIQKQDNDAVLNPQDPVVLSPLKVACNNHNLKMVEILLKNGAKITDDIVERLSELITSELCVAINTNDLAKVDSLLDFAKKHNLANKILNFSTPENKTLLELASNYDDVFKKLLLSGATITSKVINIIVGSLIVDYNKSGKISVEALLKLLNDNIKCVKDDEIPEIANTIGKELLEECQKANVDKIKVDKLINLVRENKELFSAVLNFKDENSNTLLHIAVKSLNFDMVQLLINNGAEIDLDNPNMVLANSLNDNSRSIPYDKTRINQLLVNSQLQKAKENKDITAVINLVKTAGENTYKYLLYKPTELWNFTNENGMTPFHLACVNNEKEVLVEFLKLMKKQKIAELFIKHNADASIPDENKKTAMQIICESGQNDLIDLLLTSGIDTTYDNSNTLVHIALLSGNEKLVDELISKGAQINIPNQDGKTALHIACEKGLWLSVPKLIGQPPANINDKDKSGNTPLLFATNHIANSINDLTKCEQDIAKLKKQLNELINARVDSFDKKYIDLQNSIEEKNKLLKNINTRLDESYKNLDILLKNNAKPTIPNNNGITPLAVLLGCNFKHPITIKCARLFIEAGADINTKGISGPFGKEVTLLHTTINTSSGFLKYLLDKGADPNLKDSNGRTPLMFATKYVADSHNFMAACMDKISILKYEIDVLTQSGVQNSDARLVNLAANLKSAKDELEYYKGQLQTNLSQLKYLLSNGADPKIPDNNGVTPLAVLISGNIRFTTTDEIVNLFLEKGVDINTRDIRSGETYLIKLAATGNIETLKKYIIDNKADPYLQSTYGNSVVSILLNRKYNDMANFLLDTGIDIAKVKPDSNGNTPLHIAALNGDSALVNYFISNNLSPFEKNIYGDTPLNNALFGYLRNPKKHAVFNILDKYVNNSKELLEDVLNGAKTTKELEERILAKIPDLISNLKNRENPLELALAFNSQSIARSIVKEIGKEAFESSFNKLPKEVANDFKEFLKYDLNEDHLRVEVARVPEIPEEKEYQLDALLDMFKELTGYDSDKKQLLNPELGQAFKDNLLKGGVLSPTEQNMPLSDLLEVLSKRLSAFIQNCKDKQHITGIEPGEEGIFWPRVEKAITNSIKGLKTFDGSPKEANEKKTALLREYLGIMGYCATRLDIEFEKLYHLNSGVVREFKDEIYFLLSERRSRTVDGLAPRAAQRVHYIQGMLKNLREFNIPIPISKDLYPEELQITDTVSSFKRKYQEGLIADVKDSLKSNENVREQFFQWLEDNGRTEKQPLLKKEIKESLEKLRDGQNSDLTPIQEGLMKTLDQLSFDVELLSDPRVLDNVMDAFIDPITATQEEFEKIMKSGDAANLQDEQLKQAIRESGMEGKLDSFKTKGKGVNLTHEQSKQKKKIMDKYQEIRFPTLVKQVKDEDVHFLLKELGVLRENLDVPDWLQQG